VPGLDQSALNKNNGNDKTGWNALSDTVKYVIYAAAGVVALAIIVSVYFLHALVAVYGVLMMIEQSADAHIHDLVYLQSYDLQFLFVLAVETDINA